MTKFHECHQHHRSPDDARACVDGSEKRNYGDRLSDHETYQSETVGDRDLFKKISAIPQFSICHNLAITTVAERRNSVPQQPVSGPLLR
ncbi:hypothetical protein MZK49_07145 [Ensifer sesbaniae]|uniref:hypothetical protein n=1 Tax=Ensifer sesbaniae TaxID=1214071 RepID=UPI002000E1ED|nr:hypothetical protein [Ensifer sesbaniae]